MPSSTVLDLTDPEQYEGNVRGSVIKEFVAARGKYEARLTRIDLHRLWMQRACKVLPIVSHTEIPNVDRVMIVFLVNMDQQPMLNSGMVVHPGEIVCYKAGHRTPPTNRSRLPLRRDVASSGRLRHIWTAPDRE